MFRRLDFIPFTAAPVGLGGLVLGLMSSVLLMRLRVFPVATLLAGYLLVQGTAFAQDNSAEAAGANSASQSMPAPPMPSVLTVGSIRGALTATPMDGRYSAGTSAFAQVKLSSTSTAKRGIAAELLLEVEHGEIVGVTGAALESDQEGSVRVAQLEGLRQGRDRTLLVEVKLRRAEGNPPNTLKLTLRAPRGEGGRDDSGNEPPASAENAATVQLAWRVRDCADSYHAALRRIGDEKGNRLREIWRAASRPEKSMPREWLFRPALPKNASRRRVATSDVTSSIATRDAREIFVEAGRLLRAGYDAELGMKGRHSDTLGKISNDLRKYFSQDENAAICTGAIAFTNYYEGKLSPLRKRGDKLAALSADAKQLARERVDAVFEAVRGLPEGHPGWGGATLASLRPNEDRSSDLKAMVADLGEVAALAEAAIADIKAADGPYAALRTVEDHGLDGAELPKETRADLRQALSAIEAAVLLDTFVGRYAGFWDGFYGSLQAIRDAHGKNCACDR